MAEQLKNLQSDVREVLARIQSMKMPQSTKDVRKTLENFDKRFEGVELLEQLEDQTGIPKFLVAGVGVVASIVFTVLSFYVTFLGLFTSRLIGFAYPVYRSFQAIESDDKDDDTQWLTYWVVFSFFSVFEMIALSVFKKYNTVGATYFLAKVLFLGWCQFGRGAYYLYQAFVRPFVIASNKIQEQIEKYSEAYVDAREEEHEHQD